ncbi:hypothetical protein EEB15_12155 [Ramlibacter sp. WS9]|nr:hypothetical protein EEB15_12155 [Ramlibacter sp. WS9]
MPVLANTKPLAIIEALASSQPAIDAALKSIGTVHFARFQLLDTSKPNLQPSMLALNEPSSTLVLAVITEYDGDFDAYIRDFVSQLGAVFDTLLSFVVGGAAVSPVANNVPAFEAFITLNDASQHQPNESLYTAYPQTVQLILAAFS